MNAREIIEFEKCSKSHQIKYTLGIKTPKTKSYFLSVGIKDALSKKVFKLKDLEDIFPDHPFLLIEKNVELEYLSKDLERYYQYLGNAKPDKMNITQDVNVGGKLITVSADAIYLINEGSYVDVVKVKRGKPKLSLRARSDDSMPSKSIELYLMQLMGEQLYPNKMVNASFHHLTGKNDKPGDRPPFNAKDGSNVIGHCFLKNSAERREMENRIISIMKKIETSTGEKTDDTKNCFNCEFDLLCNNHKSDIQKLRRVNRPKATLKTKEVFLTKPQRKAVMFNKGGLRMNAGAGSGKTTVIVHRYLELVEQGVDPKDILNITFTNKAALEMKERIIQWLEVESRPLDKNDIKVFTFNGWGDDILQTHYRLLGYTKQPVLIDKVAKYDLMIQVLYIRDTIEEYEKNYKDALINYKYSKGILPLLDGLFNFIKSQLIQSPECLVGKVEAGLEAEIFDIFLEYQKLVISNNFIDYQDQIRLVLQLMEESPEVFPKYKHIIVDEFQDSDEQQVEMLMFLVDSNKFESIMIVGDDAQAIYGFRNTSKDNLMKFHERFGKVTDINLEDNFRSTPEIVDIANYLNDLNAEKIEKKLVSGYSKPSGIIPEFHIFETAERQREVIADRIKDLITKKRIKNHEVAVIARTKFELFDLEQSLLDRGIPYVIDIPEPLVKYPKIRMAEHLLLFLGDGETTQGILEYLSITGFTKDKTNDEIKAEIESYIAKVETLSEEDKLQLFHKMMKMVEDDIISFFIKDLKNKATTFGETMAYVSKFIKYEDSKSVEKTGIKYNAITLTTAHTSKGKEFEVVFALLDKYSSDVKTDKEEERRTLYVAITRAKKRLIMAVTEKNENLFSNELKISGKAKISVHKD